MLWCIWAAKEAAYKAISKVQPDIPSVPRLYEVRLSLPEESQGIALISRADAGRAGEVRTPCGVVPMAIAITEDYVHCFGIRSEADAPAILRQVTLLASDTAASPEGPSQCVREKAADAIARHLNRPREEVAIRRFPTPSGLGPPLVFVRGRPSRIDISLSHDGRFAAWAMIIPPSNLVEKI